MAYIKIIIVSLAAAVSFLPSVIAGPFTVRKFGNEHARLRAQDETATDDNIRITPMNNSPNTVHIWFEVNLPDQTRHNVHDPDHPGIDRIKLLPGQSVEVGNFQRTAAGGHFFNGAVRALRGCDDLGQNCADAEGATTKWEFAADPAGHINNIGINLSLVDGFTTGGYLAYGEGSVCKAFQCLPTKQEVRAKCPADRLTDNNGHLQCKSDCKMTNSWEDCQSIEIPSSGFLKEICPAGYAWSFDHEGTYDDCDPKGEILVVIES